VVWLSDSDPIGLTIPRVSHLVRLITTNAD